MTTEDVIAHELGAAQACKVHSIKIAAAPVQHRFAARAAFINYSSGDKAAILALDTTTPAWNSDTAITVREQVSHACTHRAHTHTHTSHTHVRARVHTHTCSSAWTARGHSDANKQETQTSRRCKQAI